MNIDDAEFAVLDFETTGLFPARHDRVIEVGLVRVDAKGQIRDTFTTVVNPNRDLGLTSLHGIRGRDVENAPTFEDIVGEVLSRIEGAVLVGHNSAFDAAFLKVECDRLGVSLPSLPRLCTLCLGYQLKMAPPRRSLADACAHFGLSVGELHSALDDAQAAANLLGVYLKHARACERTALDDLGCEGAAGLKTTLPRIAVRATPLPRSEAARRPPASAAYLARLVSRLPAAADTNERTQTWAPYLEVLDRTLEDRRVTRDEADGLEQLALELGLTADDVRQAHVNYLENLAVLAHADGVISELERRDLEVAAEILGLDGSNVTAALSRAADAGARAAPGATESLAGKTVCFTGALRCRIGGELVTREVASQLAQAAGLSILTGVSKKLDLLVVADPETLSGKAKKAREYGTRILADAVFFRMIGATVD